MRRSRALPFFALGGLLPLLAGCVVHVDSGGFSARKEQRFRVEGRPTIDLATFDGTIEVQAWDRDEVLVQVDSRASSRALLEGIDVKMSQQGRRIAVEATAPEQDGWQLRGGGISRTARVVASVPVDSEVRIRSGDGAVHVERVRGVIDARTRDGRIVMREVGGEIVADSGDGAVQMEDVDGRCTVSTRDGSVLVSGRLRGGLRASSGDGTITVRAADGSVVNGDWQIETGDGGVVLALPDVLDASLDARTSDGRISLNGFPDLPIEQEGEGRRLQAVLGNGQGRLRIRTGDGSITLKRSFVPPPPAPPAPPAPPVAPESPR
ncbi:hypothetical protein TBR22_A08040 [Luteitalea sp. TBR-22]|uniref:DUF4097 family beta strand repeat-containing protein n=1 Tax=Luteitalea sp. TBR-22 TaxID=2802971 RepID=UPI001AFA9F21|nr:DUF4097 family beta strand repeat-containing protein [Luteitalea sp. TBR-22]BCS31602.1 hypothetical protein TBR22_A08040 [Luteitalea sp. TBR-22]